MKRGEKRWPDKQMWREKTSWQWIEVHLREYINAVSGQMEVSHCPLCQVKCANIFKSCILLLRNFNANRCFGVYGELLSRKNVTEFNSYILLCFLFPHGPKDKIKRWTSMHSFFSLAVKVLCSGLFVIPSQCKLNWNFTTSDLSSSL